MTSTDFLIRWRGFTGGMDTRNPNYTAWCLMYTNQTGKSPIMRTDVLIKLCQDYLVCVDGEDMVRDRAMQILRENYAI